MNQCDHIIVARTDIDTDPLIAPFRCRKEADGTCHKCNRYMCETHRYPTRLGRLCADCMAQWRVPSFPLARVRVPDQPNAGTRTAEVRPRGVLRTVRVVTTHKLLTGGGAYLTPGGAILEIDGAGEVALTQAQYEALFEEI